MLKAILKRQGAEQGTEEWLRERSGLITATDMPTILGLNPHSSKEDLLNKKKTVNPVPLSSEATIWGNLFEDVAAGCYRQKHNPKAELIQPNLVYHQSEDFLAASPDRIVEKKGGTPFLLEIKCPWKRSLSPKPAEMYLAQVQHQLEVCDLELGYLWECSFGTYRDKKQFEADKMHKIKGCQNGETYWFLKESRLTKVERDKEWYDEVVYPELKRFYRKLTCRKRGRKGELLVDSIRHDEYITPYSLVNYLRQDALLDWLEMYGEENGFRKDPTNEFFTMLRSQKTQLVERVRVELGEAKKCQSVEATNDAIRLRLPLIENAVLVIPELKMKITAPFLKFEEKEKCYRVIDIKFKKLTKLKNKQVLSLARNQIPVQLNAYWAAQALKSKQRGKEIKPLIYGSNGSGFVDLDKLELQYKTKWEDAIAWRNQLVAVGKGYKPGENTYMSPNMCNSKDYPWHSAKAELAQSLGDITQVWQCRPKHRALALEDGIGSVNSDSCTAENIGFNNLGFGTKHATTVNAILRQCRSKYQRLPMDWTGIVDHQPKRDYYIDLEFIGSLLFGKSHPNMIYLIGFGQLVGKSWEFTSMVADKLDTTSEKSILLKYKSWVESLDVVPRLIHWSSAEPSQFAKAFARHGLVEPKVEYLDLMRVFIDTPITVKGCVNFKLKTITAALSKHGLIEQNYDDSECSNGADSMIVCWKHYGFYGSNIDYEIDLMNTILKYNEIDCKVLQEIHNLF
jgi:putative phage-type endonuclease